MAHFEATAEINAARSRVWSVLMDVERWPEWTPTVTSAKRLDVGPLRVGSSTQMAQPKLKPAVWTVTELDESRGVFIWVSRNPGIVVTAGHFIEAAAGATRTKLTIDFSGFLAPVMSMLLGKLIQQYIETEARGLKQRCEAT